MAEVRTWSKQLTQSHVDLFASSNIRSQDYNTLRLYYPLDESQGTLLYEMGQRWDSRRQTFLSTSLVSSNQGSYYWERQSPLIICPQGFYMGSGNNCTYAQSWMYFYNTYTPKNVQTINEIDTKGFTMDMWIYITANSDQYFLEFGSSPQVKLQYENHGSYHGIVTRCYFPGEYRTYKYMDVSQWTFFRFTVDNTTANTFMGHLYYYYPRWRANHGSFTMPQYDRIKGHIKLFQSTNTQYLKHLTIWTSYQPSHQDTPPLNAFNMHPDYTDKTLFGHYRFEYNLDDSSPAGNHFNYPDSTASPEFKHWNRYENYFPYVSDDEPELKWSSPRVYEQFNFITGTYDGCVLKYEMDKHIALSQDITKDFILSSCSQIISSSDITTLGDPLCRFEGKYVTISIPKSNSLTVGSTKHVDLIAGNFWLGESGSTTMRATYSGAQFPRLKMTNKLIEYNRGSEMKITVSNENTGNMRTVYAWEVSSSDGSWRMENGENISNYLEITPQTFPSSGNYPGRITMTFREAPNYIDYIDFNINAFSHPKAVLTGGDRVIRKGQILTLSGNSSNDTDLGGFSNLLSFQWSCSKATKTFTQNNCEISTTTTSHLLQITTSSLQVGSYYFRMRVTKNGLTDERITEIQIIDQGVPFSISSQNQNSKYSHSIDNSFTLLLDPADELYKNYYDYAWLVVPTCIFKSVKGNMLIPEYSMTPNTEYSLQLTITYKGVSSVQSKVITTSKEPLLGNVVISPEEGEALSTLFQMNISGFTDPEDSNSLEYRVLEDGFPISQWFDSPTWEGKLNAGSEENNYSVQIQLEVRGGMLASNFHKQSLTVRFPLISNRTNYLETAFQTTTDSTATFRIIQTMSQLVHYTNYASKITKGLCLRGCDLDHGYCNHLTKTCVCKNGYANDPRCALSDYQVQEKKSTSSLLMKSIYI